MKLIGLEEHVVFPDVIAAWRDVSSGPPDLVLAASTTGDTGRRLAEVGGERLASMRATGLDVQVLSLSTPGLHNIPPAAAAALQAECNDRVAALVQANPDRFQGFATLAAAAPAEAAAELERAVTRLGLDGAMIFSRARDRAIDHRDFWPVYEAAAALRAPLYLHPMSPPEPVCRTYYGGFEEQVSTALATHRIGWHYDAGIELLRLILSGVLDRFPDLRLIVGHWGEMVLFYLDRLNPLAAIAGLPRTISEYIRQHVYITPSGMLSSRYLRWAIDVVGIDHIMFATDYPFEKAAHSGSRGYLEAAELSDDQRQRVASGTWEALRAGIRR